MSADGMGRRRKVRPGDTTRFRIETNAGVFYGAVQGSGGMLQGLAGLDRLQLASISGRCTFYEPLPGYVLVYPDFSAQGNGEGINVEIIGAIITIEAPR